MRILKRNKVEKSYSTHFQDDRGNKRSRTPTFPHFPTISTNLTYPTRKYKKNNNPMNEMKYKRRDNSDLILPIEEDDYR